MRVLQCDVCVLQCVAVCCSVLQCVAVCECNRPEKARRSSLGLMCVCCSVMCVCCSVMCVCCSVLQCESATDQRRQDGLPWGSKSRAPPIVCAAALVDNTVVRMRHVTYMNESCHTDE